MVSNGFMVKREKDHTPLVILFVYIIISGYQPADCL